MTTSKKNWAAVDKRIRSRLTTWTAEDDELLDAGLAELPDMIGNAELIDIPQPAIGHPEQDGEGDSSDAAGADGSKPNAGG